MRSSPRRFAALSRVLLLLAVVLAGCRGRRGEPLRTSAAAPFPVWREPVTGMEFVRLPAGRFRMGTEAGQAPRQADEVAHDVVLSRDFFIGRYEVTQGEWRRVMGSDPSRFAACGPRCPVESVSYHDAERFVGRLTALSGVRGLRLPSEAEWEYACRAGTRTAFATGARLSAGQANYDGRYPLPPGPQGRFVGHPTPVGSYAPNAWGLYDLHGNVWEWCADWYGDYAPAPASGAVIDPHGPARDEARRVWDARGGEWELKKVIRGGSWYFDADSCRCALRYTHAPGDSGFSLGFRLVREVTPPP